MFTCSHVWGLSQACATQFTLQLAVVGLRNLGVEGGHDVGTGGREDAREREVSRVRSGPRAAGPAGPTGLWRGVRRHMQRWGPSPHGGACDLWGPAENFSVTVKGAEFGEPVTLRLVEVENNTFRFDVLSPKVVETATERGQDGRGYLGQRSKM